MKLVLRHERAPDAEPRSARSARSSRAPVAALRPAKAVLSGGFRIASSAAARPTGVARLAAGGVRCAVAESTKEESFTYQAEARALAAAACGTPATRAAATDSAAAAAHAEHPRSSALRRSTACWTSSSTACTATRRCAAGPAAHACGPRRPMRQSGAARGGCAVRRMP